MTIAYGTVFTAIALSGSTIQPPNKNEFFLRLHSDNTGVTKQLIGTHRSGENITLTALKEDLPTGPGYSGVRFESPSIRATYGNSPTVNRLHITLHGRNTYGGATHRQYKGKSETALNFGVVYPNSGIEIGIARESSRIHAFHTNRSGEQLSVLFAEDPRLRSSISWNNKKAWLAMQWEEGQHPTGRLVVGAIGPKQSQIFNGITDSGPNSHLGQDPTNRFSIGQGSNFTLGGGVPGRFLFSPGNGSALDASFGKDGLRSATFAQRVPNDVLKDSYIALSFKRGQDSRITPRIELGAGNGDCHIRVGIDKHPNGHFGLGLLTTMKF